jgi:hopanoid biosynthesis associated protein HpnK
MKPIDLIVTADDFGRSAQINAAVRRAHRQGVLTAASLMAGGDAFDEAVEIARDNPTLAVGLHVVIVDGAPVLGADALSHVVDQTGRFPNAPAALGLRYFLDPRAKAQIAAEIAAQFARFASTGLKLTHVDGHQHLHLHPAVFPLIVSLAQRYKACGVRLPREAAQVALDFDPRDALSKLARGAAVDLMSRYCRAGLRDARLAVARRVCGLFQSGHMDEGYMMKLLHHLDAGPVEIYFHPTQGPRTDELGPNPGDLATLLSPAVAELIAARNFRLCSYCDLSRG